MRGRRLVATLFGLAIVLALGALRLIDPYPVQALREISFDFFQRLQQRPVADLPVRVVDVDEKSLARIGQWPWPRATIAKLNDRLAELGAAAIAYDVLFPEPDRGDPAGDDVLAASLARTPAVLGFSVSSGAAPMAVAPKSVFARSGVDPTPAIPHMPGAVVPLAKLREAAPGLGSVSLNSEDLISVTRRVPLLWTDGTSLYPTLSVEALRIAFGIPTLVVLGETQGPGFVEGLRIGPLNVPTTRTGDLVLWHRSPSPDLYVSAGDVLGDSYQELAPRIAGSIVLIGTSAAGLFDLHGTPLGENVPGVSIHAQAIQQMLLGAYLIRADWVSGIELLGFIVAGVFLVFVVLRLGPRAGLLAGAAIVAGTAGFSWYMFTGHGLLIDPSFPAVGSTLVYGAIVYFNFAITDADRRQVRRAFGHYVSPALLAEIEKTGDLRLGGETRPLTVMFSDMRGFTPLSEILKPQRMLAVLNTLFGALGEEIVTRYGTIDKFVGDAIMAFWNAPIDVPNHPHRACDAALAMRSRLRALNAEDAFAIRAEGRQIAIGIGISTGDALVGNMGLESRFDYSCIGDTVNTASRVESGTKELGYDILITGAVREEALGMASLYGGALSLKGKSLREPVFLLVGDEAMAATESFKALAAVHAEAVALLRSGKNANELIARCAELGKTVDPSLASFYELLSSRTEDFA